MEQHRFKHFKVVFIRRHSKDYNFIADTATGITMRWGESFEVNPKRAPAPELIDISISNHCSKGCNVCYRDSEPNDSFMSVLDYEFVLKSLFDERWGNVFQVALGGGEPLEHPNFLEILKITRRYNIVPNFTTNALHISKDLATDIKSLIGAVAISFRTLEDIPSSNAYIFIDEGIRTNIHFILDRRSIIEGIKILEGKYNPILSGFNSIIFLTFKPLGRNDEDLSLKLNEELISFCKLIDNHNCSLEIGFDSCFMPLIMHLTKTNIDFIEPCECAFFSAYIDENLNVKPCSFANQNKETFNLKEERFYDIWNDHWEQYRNSQVNSCERECRNKSTCRGGCPFYSQINLCKTDVTTKQLS